MILLVVGGVVLTAGVAVLLSHVGKSQPLITPEIPQKPTRLVQTNGDVWTCQYCLTDNKKNDVSCVRCGSPHKFSKVVVR